MNPEEPQPEAERDYRAELSIALARRMMAEREGKRARRGKKIPHRSIDGVVMVWKREGMTVRVEMSTGRRFKLTCSSAAFARQLMTVFAAAEVEEGEDAVDFMRRCVRKSSEPHGEG